MAGARPKTRRRRREHFRRAADRGHAWAQYNLGHMYLDGRGVARDRALAYLYYLKAAEQRHERAMNLVGRCCEEGWGTPRDADAAADWYRRSAEAGYFRGQYNWASLLLQGGPHRRGGSVVRARGGRRHGRDAPGRCELIARAGAPRALQNLAARLKAKLGAVVAAPTSSSAVSMFLRIPKVLSEEQLATMRASLDSENAPWVDGRVTAGHQGAPVKNNQQIDEASPMARELGNFVLAQLERNALFISAVLPNRVYPPMFNRYGEGMHFGTHVDGVGAHDPRQSPTSCAPICRRPCSSRAANPTTAASSSSKAISAARAQNSRRAT